MGVRRRFHMPTRKGGVTIRALGIQQHKCSHSTCGEPAITIMRDTQPHWPTFTNGAGYVCPRHATIAQHAGCVVV